MVTVEHIGHSRSVEFVNRRTGTSEWMRFETKVSFTSPDELDQAVDTAVMVVENSFQKHAPQEMQQVSEQVQTTRHQSKVIPDPSILALYQRYIEEDNKAMIEKMESIYDLKR